MSEWPDTIILKTVVCNRCDAIIDMHAVFGDLDEGEEAQCPCGSTEFAYRGVDDDTGRQIDCEEANLERGRRRWDE